MSGMKVFWLALLLFVIVLLSTAHSSVLRCDLLDPHGRESEICWKQFLLKNYPQVPLLVQENENVPDAPVPVRARNAELSSALMQLYGFNNKFNGKRNPDFSRDVMRYMSDVNKYKEN